MAAVSEVITLGVGTPSSIPFFLTAGLGIGADIQPADSSLIDAALVAKLVGDATLMALMTDGVYFDYAPPGKTKCVIVSLTEQDDVGEFQQRAYEDAIYTVQAVALGSSGGDVKTAAARIDVLLEDATLAADIPGYHAMTVHREARVRYTELDLADPTQRWQYRGGRYRVQMAFEGAGAHGGQTLSGSGAAVDSSQIDDAIASRLLNDTTLMTLMPDGVYFDAGRPGATRFIVVSLVDELDVGEFQQRAYEDALYLIKAVALNTSGGDVKTAAERIDLLFEDQLLAPEGSPSTLAGYSSMTVHRESRVRYAEVDAVDPIQRWQHRGGRYRIQMAVDSA